MDGIRNTDKWFTLGQTQRNSKANTYELCIYMYFNIFQYISMYFSDLK